MGGVEEDEWPEEEREDPPAKRPEIRELESKEEYMALTREDFWSLGPGSFFPPRFDFSLEEERAVSPALSCDSMRSDDSMDYPMAF